jgi:hypothetical protein
MTVSDKVRMILDSTPPDYLLNTAKLHLVSYPTVNTPEDLLYRLGYENNWQEFQHPNIMKGCQGFIAQGMFGYLGIMHVQSLPKDVNITFADPKGTGFAMGEVKDIRPFRKVEHTVLIAGEHEGKTICFTFHAGDPISPSLLPAAEWNGRTISVWEALGYSEIQHVRITGR